MPKYRIKNSRGRFLLGFVNLSGYLIYGWSRFGAKSLDRQAPKNILVLQLDEIGDVLLSTPALRLLRKIFPEAKITAVVRQPGHEILSGNPNLDRLVLADLPRFSARTSGIMNDLRKIRQFAPGLKSKLNNSFDLGIDLRADLRAIYLLKKIGPPVRISQSIRGGGFWLTHVAPYHGEQHETARKIGVINFLRPDYPAPADSKLEISIAPEHRQSANDKLTAQGVLGSEKLAVLHPFAGWKPKEWPADRFAQIAKYLATEHRLKVVIIGSPAEKIAAEKIARAAAHPGVVSLAGTLDLKTTAAVIGRADIFIGNDSGPMHLACAVQTPVIALFGQNTPQRYGPWQNKSLTLYHQVECSPCPQTECRRRPSCLEIISVDEVKKAVNELLKNQTCH